MQIQEILIVQNAHENYGISTEDINQISRVPLLMPLPLRPSGVRGLCSFSGSVVSMVDMNLLLDMQEVDLEDSRSRLISLNNEFASNTLLVSDVYNTVEIEQENIDYIDKENDPVIAIYKYEGMLIQVLSLETLFERMNKVEIPARDVSTGKIKNEISKEEESSRFLVFSMSQEKYALNIDYLQEIILADVAYTDIAGSSKELLGLITLRDELLMVVDLRVHYGFESKKADENRILIISYDGKKIGFCIDSIIDIKKILTKNIEPMGESFNDSKIAGVIHDEESLISYFDHKVISEIFSQNAAFVDDHSDNEEELESDVQEYVMEVIVFKLAGKEYAFNVENVDEIIDNISSTDVAFTDESIDGIINIRGQIVTTVSLFSKLDIPALVTEESKIIICNILGNRIGFVVDSVSDILSVKEQEIREESDKYFDSILYLENGNRLVLSMDIEKIINKEQDNG
jgi:purine-binding chemotaxis protein CheW